MAKENPPAKEMQVAFDLGDEASNPPSTQAGAAKKARANPEKPTGKLVKNREGGRGAARERVGEKQAAKPPVSKPVTAAQSDSPKPDPSKPMAPHIPETKAEPTKSPPANNAPIISIADESGSPKSRPEKGATPQPERPMPVKEPEPATGNGAEPAGHPPVEIPASEEMAGEETERIIQLINNHEGCWKVLSGGERVALSDQEWRSELARHFRRETPAGG